VSAELSLFAWMRSLRVSASRFAAAMRSWISVWFCDTLDARTDFLGKMSLVVVKGGSGDGDGDGEGRTGA